LGLLPDVVVIYNPTGNWKRDYPLDAIILDALTGK